MPTVNMGNGKSFVSEFGGVEQADHTKHLAQSIASREQEVYQYQVNINNFELMLSSMAGLPVEWPADLVQYRNADRDNLIASLDEQTLEIVSCLIFRDQIRQRIRSEKIEQRKADLVLQTLKSQVLDVEAIRAQIAVNKSNSNNPL